MWIFALIIVPNSKSDLKIFKYSYSNQFFNIDFPDIVK